MLQRRKVLFNNAASGQALILAIVFLAIIASASSALLGYVGSVAKFEKTIGEEKLALQIAQAGLDKTVWCLNQSDGANCGGTYGSNYSGETSVSSPPGVFSTAVTSIDSFTKDITSTGYIPGAANPLFIKTIKARAAINTTDVSFSFGLQVGDGGLEMGEGAEVRGSVYANGDINGDNNAEITGDAYAASAVSAVPNQEWSETNGDFTFGQGSPQTDVAQSFIPSASGSINKLSFYVRKTGSPTNRTVRIVRDDDNEPSKTTIETGTLMASQVTASYGWVNVALDDLLAVTSGTRYWIIIDAVNNTDNYWQLASETPGDYGGGKGMYSPDWNAGRPVWTDAGADFNFKVWFSGDISKIDNVDMGGDAHANTIKDSTVDGDAYYQTLDNTTVIGASYPGSPDPAPTVFPISDNQINDWKAEAAAEGTIAGDVHPAKDETISLGPTKITGNLILDDGQTLIVTGTLYVQGNVDIGNKGKIQLSPSYGSNSGIIISDGWMHFENNGAFSGAGAGSYLMMLSLSFGGGHHDSAMDLHNNVIGVLLYAPNGFINLHNNVATTQITAKRIKLSNGCVLTYDFGLANVKFSSGPGGSWKFLSGTWRIIN